LRGKKKEEGDLTGEFSRGNSPSTRWTLSFRSI